MDSWSCAWPADSRLLADQVSGQSGLAAASGPQGTAGPQALRHAVAAGAVENPGRQGPRAVDLFGSSEQGPARPFWRSFFSRPRRQCTAELGEQFIRRLLHTAYESPWRN